MAESQKPGRPTDRKMDEWEHDLHPNPEAGQNRGLESSQAERNVPTAYDLKELHQYLKGFTDDELKQITVLTQKTRLQQGATYVDLTDSEREEFTAMGGMEVAEGSYYIPKTEVDYQLWNRLTEVQKNPARVVNSSGTTQLT